jgi:hypothetical protein
MLARITGSAKRAPPVGGQPRGGGASGPARCCEWIAIGSRGVGDAARSAALAIALVGTVSVRAQAGIALQALGRCSASQPSLVVGAAVEARDAGMTCVAAARARSCGRACEAHES